MVDLSGRYLSLPHVLGEYSPSATVAARFADLVAACGSRRDGGVVVDAETAIAWRRGRGEACDRDAGRRGSAHLASSRSMTSA